MAVLLMLFALALPAQSLHFGLPFVIKIGDEYGFMDRNCRVVIPAQYPEAFDFSDGLAAVKVGERWGYIDQSGANVITPQFAGAWFFSDGMASVKLDNDSPLWGFIDKTGKVVIQPQFGMPLWFSEGLVEGYGEKNRVLNIPLGYVDKAGKYVIRVEEPGLQIQFLVGFSEGLARVSMWPLHADGSVGPSKYGYIDHSGKWVIPRMFEAADDFHEGFAAATGRNGKWGYIDKTGRFQIAPRFEQARQFSEGLAAVKLDGKWGWVDKTGNQIIASQFAADEIGTFRDGMAMVVLNRRIGYVNTSGEMVIPQTLTAGTEFSDGVALVSQGQDQVLIDRSGKTLCHAPIH